MIPNYIEIVSFKPSTMNTRVPFQKSQEIKRYASYAELIDKVNIPSMQRSRDPKRVDEMEKHIHERAKRNLEPIFGAIDLVELDVKLYVIDGQHRLNALEQAYKSNLKAVPFNCVIYHVNSKEEMEEIFTTRNKGVPVPDFILNHHDKKELLKEIENWLRTPVLGFRDKCMQRPYISIGTFMDALAKSEILNLIENANDFRDIYIMINNKTRESYKNNQKNGVTRTMLDKCEKMGNWVGLDKNLPWLSDDYDVSRFSKMLDEKRKIRQIQSVTRDQILDDLQPGDKCDIVDDLS